MPYSLSPRKIFCEVLAAIDVYGYFGVKSVLRYKTIKKSDSMYRASVLFLQFSVQFFRCEGLVAVALTRIEGLQAGIEHRQQLLVTNQTPPLGVVVARGCLARKALHNKIGAQATQDLDKEIEERIQDVREKLNA